MTQTAQVCAALWLAGHGARCAGYTRPSLHHVADLLPSFLPHAAAVVAAHTTAPVRPSTPPTPSSDASYSPARARSRSRSRSPASRRVVYRDAAGRQLDVVAEARRRVAAEEARVAREAVARRAWDTGAGDKTLAAQAAATRAAAAAAPMGGAAAADTAELRALDPMAQFEAASTAPAQSLTGKPLYRGPPAPPNRFGIPPGYRWDGTVRGTGWEQKLADAAVAKQRREAARQSARLGAM